MTQALEIQPAAATEVRIGYRLAMPDPTNHLLALTLTVENWRDRVLDVKLPIWTPGSYLTREYAKQLQDFRAIDADGRPLVSEKAAKNHWRVECGGSEIIEIHYRLFAYDLTVRTNHFDRTHAFIVGAATFFRIPGYEQQPIEVEVVPPESSWQVATTLEELEPGRHGPRFRAPDFDTLVDSPFEIGIHETFEFEACGKPHAYKVWGKHNGDLAKISADTAKIIGVEAELFGDGLPYDRYLFILLLAENSYGGLEHKDSCALIFPRFKLRARADYDRFMQLVAHEFFHLWNVKRLRPQAIEAFDYDRENYTPSLWFCEGVTSYYDILIPLWAGIYDVGTFLSSLSKDITRYLKTPGRLVQPLSESSWDAWIKLYRRDSNSDNSQISYYLKGMMVSLLLDLEIRKQSNNARSLDDLMRSLWRKFGQDERGYSQDELLAECTAIAGTDLTEFFDRFLHGTDELPLGEYLEDFGLAIEPQSADVPSFGARLAEDDNSRAIVKFVEVGSPAQRAGIAPEDEILAIDAYRPTAPAFPSPLHDSPSSAPVPIPFFPAHPPPEIPLPPAAPPPPGNRSTPPPRPPGPRPPAPPPRQKTA